MVNNDSGYFGMQLGQALSAGAGHISQALQRKYQAQAEAEERKRMMEEQGKQQGQSMRLAFAKEGIEYDPNNPEAAFSQYAQATSKTRGLEQQKTQAEIAKLQAGPSGQMATPPPGYRFLPNGSLEAIPGGPADVKASGLAEKKQLGIETQKIRNQNVIDTVDSALKDVGMFTSGFAGNMLKNVGGTSAADLEGKINTIQANLGFDRLTEMRAESPTGGALGQVSERELTLLTSAVASLSQKQSPAQLRENLARVKQHLENWQSTVEKAKGDQMAPEIQVRTLKDGSQVKVRRAIDGSWEEVE